MVCAARCRRAWLPSHVVQQGGGAHDLQVGAFGQRQALGHAVNAQDVVKVVHGVAAGVPARGLVQWLA